MRTGGSNRTCVSLSPTSITLPRISEDASSTPSAAATADAFGAHSETYTSSRPSAGTELAFEPGGIATTANVVLIVTPSAGNVTSLAVAFCPSGASPRAVTLIAARTVSPAPVASTTRTKLSGVISTTGAWPAGLDTAFAAPAALTGIVSFANACLVRSGVAPSRSALTAISPACVAFTPAPPNVTACVAVPSPPTSASAAASRPPGPVTAPYTGPA